VMIVWASFLRCKVLSPTAPFSTLGLRTGK
jgi:hypothetical protein